MEPLLPALFPIHVDDHLVDSLLPEEARACWILLHRQWVKGCIPLNRAKLAGILGLEEKDIPPLMHAIKRVFSESCGKGRIRNHKYHLRHKELLQQLNFTEYGQT